MTSLTQITRSQEVASAIQAACALLPKIHSRLSVVFAWKRNSRVACGLRNFTDKVINQ